VRCTGLDVAAHVVWPCEGASTWRAAARSTRSAWGHESRNSGFWGGRLTVKEETSADTDGAPAPKSRCPRAAPYATRLPGGWSSTHCRNNRHATTGFCRQHAQILETWRRPIARNILCPCVPCPSMSIKLSRNFFEDVSGWRWQDLSPGLHTVESQPAEGGASTALWGSKPRRRELLCRSYPRPAGGSPVKTTTPAGGG
jgi:hypothetical protein